MSNRDFVIVGLGNPGVEYELTRHNAGFIIVDALADYFGASSEKTKWKGIYSVGGYKGVKLHFVKPQTYMNRSGESVVLFTNFFKAPLSQILVVHDDLDMATARIKLVQGGGHGGHNGIKSLVQCLAYKSFYRLKIGIGRPGQGDVHKNFPVEKYVLSRFSDLEMELVESRIEKICEGLEFYFAGDVSRATGILNSLK